MKKNNDIIILKQNDEVIEINIKTFRVILKDNEGLTSSYINLFDALKDATNYHDMINLNKINNLIRS